MAALTSDYVPSGYKTFRDAMNPIYVGCIDDDIIYKFALLELDAAGDVSPFSAKDNDFAGVAMKQVDNEGGDAGDVKVPLYTRIIIKGVDLAGTTPDVGDAVYCNGTDNIADLTTADPGSGTRLGTVVGRRAEGTDADYDVELISTVFGD